MKANRFKFRTWDGMFMEYDVYPCGDGAVCSRDQETIVEPSGKPGAVKDSDDTCMIWEKKPVIMQSTGLSDKKGREIFEGDILVEDCPRGNKFVVEWDDLHASFHIAYDEKHHTIIGNIYENAELIKERNI